MANPIHTIWVRRKRSDIHFYSNYLSSNYQPLTFYQYWCKCFLKLIVLNQNLPNFVFYSESTCTHSYINNLLFFVYLFNQSSLIHSICKLSISYSMSRLYTRYMLVLKVKPFVWLLFQAPMWIYLIFWFDLKIV